MRFAKLFPKVMDEELRQSSAETISIGRTTIDVKQAVFSPITALTKQEKAHVPDARWVDGGSAVLFSTPSRCIGIIKTCAVSTKGMTRDAISTSTYLASVTLAENHFLCRCEALSNPDERIATALQRDVLRDTYPSETTPEQLLDALRTLAELAICDETTVRDGSIRTTDPLVQKESRNLHCAHISKTSGILTNHHRPAALALLERAPTGSWQVSLSDINHRERKETERSAAEEQKDIIVERNEVVENINDPSTSLVRLHDRASHVFLIENATAQTIALLHSWSTDMAFPGYPYPLVLADQFARVTNNERDTWKLIMASDEQASRIITGELKASDAHAMLEHILYGKE